MVGRPPRGRRRDRVRARPRRGRAAARDTGPLFLRRQVVFAMTSRPVLVFPRPRHWAEALRRTIGPRGGRARILLMPEHGAAALPLRGRRSGRTPRGGRDA